MQEDRTKLQDDRVDGPSARSEKVRNRGTSPFLSIFSTFYPTLPNVPQFTVLYPNLPYFTPLSPFPEPPKTLKKIRFFMQKGA